MRILEIGPSPEKSKGGMATVIEGIIKDKNLNESFDIDAYPSYIDGNLVIRAVYSVFSIFRFFTVYKKYDLFHIHVASYGSTFRKKWYVDFLMKHGKKIIIHVHGGGYLIFYNKINQRKKKKVIDFLKSANMVIALSDKWKKDFEQTFGLTNCVALNNGINTEEFKKAQVNEVKFKDNFLFLGRLSEQKGAYDLVDAIAKVKEQRVKIKLFMAGDGEINKVNSLVQEKNLQDYIEVIGWVNFDQKIKYLQQVSTVVLPSYNEGLPMSILEGMASGKAIISTTVGAIPEVVKKENGILISPGDVNALADALIRCSCDIKMLESVSKNNVAKIDNEFSQKKMHEELARYYKQVMKE
jgi:glycosyltransferase involved in cell wall biosynthesis